MMHVSNLKPQGMVTSGPELEAALLSCIQPAAYHLSPNLTTASQPLRVKQQKLIKHKKCY